MISQNKQGRYRYYVRISGGLLCKKDDPTDVLKSEELSFHMDGLGITFF